VETAPDANRLLCRYTGTAWDCGSASFNASAGTVTRNRVSEFSDWSIGVVQYRLQLPLIHK
jgi:hypothetical protein